MRNRKITERQLREKPALDENKKIIAVDFDGTLVHNHYPFIENPNMELIRWIKENRNKYIFILWTCRSGEQLQLAVDWLKSQGIEFDLVNENCEWLIAEYGDTRKVYADYYIDDKNVIDYREIGGEQECANG